jgi:predicted nucleic acid-binding protein
MIDKIAAPNKCFIDSNVWLYALSTLQDARKHAIANQLLRSTGFMISTQAINEVCRNLIKKASFSDAQIKGVIAPNYSRYLSISPSKASYPSMLITGASCRRYFSSQIGIARVSDGI